MMSAPTTTRMSGTSSRIRNRAIAPPTSATDPGYDCEQYSDRYQAADKNDLQQGISSQYFLGTEVE